LRGVSFLILEESAEVFLCFLFFLLLFEGSEDFEESEKEEGISFFISGTRSFDTVSIAGSCSILIFPEEESED